MSRVSPFDSPKSRILTPLVAFVLCLLLTAGAAFFAFESAKTENSGRFDRAIGAFRDTLHNRMTVYTNAIIYTRNLFNVKPDLTEDEFHSFVSQMALRENFPGIQTIGYVERMPIASARSYLKAIRVSEKDAALRQESDTADLVHYVTILNDSGRVSIRGVDLGASPERLEAMNEARDTGLPAASNRVTTMQVAGNGVPKYAFLIFTPLYRTGMPVGTVDERRAALRGFVYGGFRAENLFGRVTEDARFRKADFIVRIYDGSAVRDSALMYSEGPREISHPLLSRDFGFAFADHTWTLRVVAPQSYSVAALRWLPGLVFSLGLLLSVALALALRRSQALTARLADDIAHRKQTEELLRQARSEAEEANRAKSIFLANISHEIRTPLGVMLGFSEMALNQDSPSERAESLRTVIRNGRELTRIIGDVLDVSKIEAQTLKLEDAPFSLSQMIRDVVAIWRPQIEAKGVDFNLDVARDLPPFVSSDETRIKQVLTNLLSNAVKFTSAGSVSFSVSSQALEGARVRLTFTVSDSGIGISESQRARLFKPFSQGDSSITRKFGGSGLGLALSRSIAQTLGGELTLAAGESGASFLFEFPASVVANVSAAEPTATGSLKGRKILLVDDSADNRALVSLMLKKAEASVDVAVDGEDGVAKALAASYDLILMDIQMPNKDGYTALRELQEHSVRVPVIALTAHALSEERERALSVGFAGYITKPVDRETLVRISAETLA